MKRWGLILGFSMVCCFAIGQSFNQDSVRYITPTEEAFMIDKETKSLLKIDFKRDEHFQSDVIFATYEQKIIPSLSISGSLNYRYNLVNAAGELRYYHRMNKRIEAGLQNNNLSDNYFSIKYESSVYDNLGIRDRVWSVGYGIQRRVLNKYFIDYNIFLDNSRGEYISLLSRAKFGLGFGKQHKFASDALCPILKCSIDKYSLFKINFNNAFGVSYVTGAGFGEPILGLFINPDLDYEVKLGQSSWSFIQNVNLSYSRVFRGEGEARDLRFQLRSGVRFYHSLKKRMQLGKSGNNLNGGYFLLRGRYINSDSKFDNSFGGQVNNYEDKRNASFADFGYGYQTVILEKFYVDVALGMTNGDFDEVAKKPKVFFDLKAGFAF